MPGAMRGSVVERAPTFEADVAGLRDEYPAIDGPVNDLDEFLRLDYDLPEITVDPSAAPNVYAVKLDYPPQGAGGRSRFLVTYHATDAQPSPVTPYRTFTLLTITERRHG